MILALPLFVIYVALPVVLVIWLVSTLGAIRRNGERTVQLLEQVLRDREGHS